MKNIHIITTDKPSRFWMTKLGNLTRCNDIRPIKESLGNNLNIYITSDEPIKEGDWFLPKGHINPHKLKGFNKINGDLESYNGLCYDISKCKKIILTTDQNLIKDGVQAIDDEFLQWFVNNPSCESVEVVNDIPYKPYPYEIIIPKEEPKQEKVLLQSSIDGEVIWGEHKQETLEEAGVAYAKTVNQNHTSHMLGFHNGAKWQQEQIGKSEFLQKLRATMSDAEARRLIFETFKNK